MFSLFSSVTMILFKSMGFSYGLVFSPESMPKTLSNPETTIYPVIRISLVMNTSLSEAPV